MINITPNYLERQKAKITLSAIKKRVSNGEVLVIIHSKVYNLTKWIEYHPGGALAIKHLAGKDVTDQVLVFHPPWVLDKIDTYYIGDLEEKREDVVSTEFQQLHEKLKTMGYYVPNFQFYVYENIKFAALLLSVILLTVYGNQTWHYVLGATLLASLWHQVAFVAHDAGHSAVFTNRKKDTLYGIFLANFIGGLSIGWWKHSHYVHHIMTNHVEHDPDIQHLPFFAVSAKFKTSKIFSTFHNRMLDFDRFADFFIPKQHRLYYIVLAFGRFNLYVQSWLFVLRHPKVPFRSLEILGMFVYGIWFSTLLSYLPTTGLKVLYVAVSHMITMILHLQITLSHFGMSTEEVEGYFD